MHERLRFAGAGQDRVGLLYLMPGQAAASPKAKNNGRHSKRQVYGIHIMSPPASARQYFFFVARVREPVCPPRPPFKFSCTLPLFSIKWA